ncbi:MAG: SDR family NAD(P)-dependent oxidoreductase [Phycisphaerae bacterium]|nr:SDR family NAD(P)-dependent oxidoreductase [Phycisphaerae bacterium]
MANRGFRVCLTARRKYRLEEITSKINATYGADRAIYFAGDVTDHDVRTETFQLAMSRWGQLGVLVNNAGAALPGAVEEVGLDEVRREFEVNTFASLAWMHLVGPIMRKQGKGRIINISSISGRIAFPVLGVYAATKFALEALSDSARVEYEPWGVKVILIEPGSIVTEIWEKSHKHALALRPDWQSSPFRSLYESEHRHAQELMNGHGPSPTTIAKAVCNAATAKHPKARYCLPLDARIATLLSHFPTRFRDWIIRRMLRADARCA